LKIEEERKKERDTYLKEREFEKIRYAILERDYEKTKQEYAESKKENEESKKK